MAALVAARVSLRLSVSKSDIARRSRKRKVSRAPAATATRMMSHSWPSGSPAITTLMASPARMTKQSKSEALSTFGCELAGGRVSSASRA